MSVRVKTSSGWVNVAGNELGLISNQWNEDDTYTIGEYVYHKSFIWKCLARNENEEPTVDNEYWEKIDSVMSEVFQYVDNGKELVADAITDKGVATSKTDTFATMATNISQISGGGGSSDPKISVNAQISDTTHYMTANTLQDYAKFQQILIDIVVADTHYYTLKNTSDIVSGEEFVVNSHRGANVMKIVLTSSTVSATYYTGSFVDVYCNILGIGGGSSIKTVYDLGYVDDSMLFWLDGKSTTPFPYDTEAGEEPLSYWTMKKCRIEGEPSFQFGSDNHWKEGGGLTFIKTRKSWGWYGTYFQTPANVTIELYFDATNFSTGNNEIFSSRESGGMKMGIMNGGNPYCGTTIGDIVDDTTTIQENTKYHLAFTYDRQNMKLYVNGVLKKTVANTSAITSAGTGWWLGNDGTGTTTESSPSTYAFNGTIYAVRMYDRILDADEILSNYQIDVNRFGE